MTAQPFLKLTMIITRRTAHVRPADISAVLPHHEFLDAATVVLHGGREIEVCGSPDAIIGAWATGQPVISIKKVA